MLNKEGKIITVSTTKRQERNGFIWHQSPGDLSKFRKFVNTDKHTIKLYEPKKIAVTQDDGYNGLCVPTVNPRQR
jgi:uncharacterized protein with NRDE domain